LVHHVTIILRICAVIALLHCMSSNVV
jgi:hypothetical protein